jgi:hypothetical protein
VGFAANEITVHLAYVDSSGPMGVGNVALEVSERMIGVYFVGLVVKQGYGNPGLSEMGGEVQSHTVGCLVAPVGHFGKVV